MRCFILAGGPSLNGFDFHRLDGEVTIGINFVCKYYKPTVLVFGDLRVYTGDTKANCPAQKDIIDSFDCIKITKKGNPAIQDTFQVTLSNQFWGRDGLKNGLYTDFMTGVWTLSLAIALGFDQIYLLGYDCCFDKKVGGHFYSTDFKHKGDFLESSFQTSASLYKVFRDWPGVYNCSDISLIKEFPKVDIDEVLKTKGTVDIKEMDAYIRGELQAL